MISFNICTQFFITHFHTQSPQGDIFDETVIQLILILTTETAVTPAVTKSLCFITLAPVCLTLFLAFAAVTPETDSWNTLCSEFQLSLHFYT